MEPCLRVCKQHPANAPRSRNPPAAAAGGGRRVILSGTIVLLNEKSGIILDLIANVF